MLEFKILTNDNKVVFKTPYRFIDNTYSFLDLSLENTTINLKIINKNHITLIKKGMTKMSVDFILNQTTNLYYENNYGIIKNMTVKATKIKISENNILVIYNSYMDNEYLDNHKIWVIIKK